MRYLIIFFIMMATTTLFGRINYRFMDRVLVKQGDPKIFFIPQTFINTLDITVTAPGKKVQTFKFNDLLAKKEVVVTLKQKAGTKINYMISLDASLMGNKTLKDHFNFTGVKLNPMVIKPDISGTSLEQRRIKFITDRPATKVILKLYNQKGKLFYQRELPAMGRINTVTWPAKVKTIGTAQLQVYDQYGFWSSFQAKPVSIHIPHEEIRFTPGSAAVSQEEFTKIEHSLVKIDEVIQKYGTGIPLNLYIAGYTDTVGSKRANIKLSYNRAKSIGMAFKKAGLKISLYYQGFGESVLHKLTKDNRSEEMNRRAIYVVASQSPEKTRTIPRKRWRLLK